MTDEDYPDPTEAPSMWQIAEQLAVGVVVVLPAVLFFDGAATFEQVTVAYLAGIAFLAAIIGGRYHRD